jgi:hypothetical protein
MYVIKNINLLEKRFGRLVVKELGEKDHRGNRLWKCHCDCGNKTEVTTGRLRNGNTQSCGCMQIESARNINLLPSGESAKTRLFHQYKHDAKARDISFELTKSEFFKLTKELCFYCTAEPAQLKQGKRDNGPYVYNGVDRSDNFCGYTNENCVSCCKRCNFMKLEMSVPDFIAACRAVVNHFDAQSSNKVGGACS